MKKLLLLILFLPLYLSAQTTIEYTDNFENFNSVTLFGSPLPVRIGSILGRSGVFDNNGDQNNNSGAVSKQTFDISRGFKIESDVYLDFKDSTGCWAGTGIGIANPTLQSWGGYDSYIYFSLQANGDACSGTPQQTRRRSVLQGGFRNGPAESDWETFGDLAVSPLFADGYANSWHTLRIEVGQDGIPRFFVDNTLIYTGTTAFDQGIMGSPAQLWIGGRSSGSAGKAYNDWIKLTTTSNTTASVTLTNPKGGELWAAASSQSITWESHNITNVALAYSTDNGTSWTAITNMASTGSYTWKVPNAVSSQFRVKVADINDAALNSVSNAFTVYSSPSAATNAATDVTANTATLNGTVNANNSQASVSFEYGPTTAYGSSASALESPLNGAVPQNVSAPISNLTPGAVYHFRVKAVNAAGTVYGSDQTFTAGSINLSVVSPAGGEQWQAGTSHDITWTSRNVKNIKIEYSANDGRNWTVIAAGTAASAGSYAWVVPGQLSSAYRIRLTDASNAAVTSTSNAFSVFSLPSAQTNAPSDVTLNSALLKASVNAGNTLTAISFEYGLSTLYGTNSDAVPPSLQGTLQTDVSAALSGLTPGTVYHYRVKASNSAGIVYGGDQTFTTDALALKLTSPSGGEKWQSASTHAITWTSKNVISLSISYSADDGASWVLITSNTPASAGSYQWKVPDVASSAYRIKITDSSNPLLSSQSNAFSVYSIPAAATNNATDITVNSAVLNGTVNASNSPSIVTFEYGTTTSYGLTIGALQSPIDGTAAVNVSAPITGLRAGTLYHFRVKAVNSAGTSYGSDQTFTADNINLALSSPKGGEEWLAGSNQDITWTQKNVSNVMVLYSLDGGKSWITIADAAPASAGSYKWKVPDSLSSQYRVRIIDIDNLLLSSSSNSFSVFRLPWVSTDSASNVSTTSALLRGFVKAGNTSTTVEFEYGSLSGYAAAVSAAQNPVKGTNLTSVSALLTGLTPGLPYHFRIKATNGAGTAYGSDRLFITDSITLALSAPAGGESWKAGSSQYISWNVRNVANVKIEYSKNDGVTWTIITGSTSASAGRYLWTVPDSASPKYRIRVSDASNPLLSLTSKTFSVYSLPVAVTKDPSEVSINSAVLYASVSAGNSPSTVTFEYGTSPAGYDSSIAATPNVISGLEPTDVTASLTGLSQGSIYHYRIKATNNAGSSYGSDKTFTTAPVSLKILTPAGGEQWLSGTTQNITWESKNVVSIKIEYSTDEGVDWNTISSNVLSGLKSYSWKVPEQLSSGYRIRITNNNIFAPLSSSSKIFSVYSMPTALTKAPTDITSVSATLKGSVNAGNAETNAVFEYGTTTIYGSTINAAQNPLDGVTDSDVSAPLTGLTPGTTYHYRLRAVNSAGTAFGSDMTFTVLSPELKLTSPSNGEEIIGSVQYTITWTSSNISNVNIEYSIDNGTSWSGVASGIPASQGSYIWTVPNNINSASCRIRITDSNNPAFTDIINGTFRITTYAKSISLSGKSFTFSDPMKQSSYRMIGLPGESSSLKMPQFVQGTAKKDWTMYYDNGSSNNYYVEYDGSASFSFAPGRGFWVLSKNPVNLSGTVSTVTLSTDGTYSIKIDHAGWNIISSPYEIAIPWASVQALNAITEPISGWNGSSFSVAQNMNPYEGYYFYNSRNLKALKIPYRSTVKKAGPSMLQKAVSSETAPEAAPGGASPAGGGSSITLSLMDQDTVISRVVMGTDKNSTDDYDAMDEMAPPGDFEQAGMRIVNQSLSTDWKQLFIEYRNSIGQGQRFALHIRNNTGKSLRLNPAIPDNFNGSEIYLLDKRLKKLHNLGTGSGVEIPSYVKELDCEVLIGSSAFIEEESRRIMPQEFSLFQNFPNPFNPVTVIRYSVPEDAVVTIKIFDIIGREVKEAVNGFNEAGYHEVSFDARGISSGVYYYSMEAKSPDGTLRFRGAKKMLLIK